MHADVFDQNLESMPACLCAKFDVSCMNWKQLCRTTGAVAGIEVARGFAPCVGDHDRYGSHNDPARSGQARVKLRPWQKQASTAYSSELQHHSLCSLVLGTESNLIVVAVLT